MCGRLKLFSVSFMVCEKNQERGTPPGLPSWARACMCQGWLCKEQASGQEPRSENATLTGWKVILATVVKDMLRKSGEMFCKGGTADSTANICEFMDRAKCKDISPKVIAAKLCIGCLLSEKLGS